MGIAGHKSLNNNLVKIAKFSEFHKPVLSSPHTSQTMPSPINSSSCSTAPTCPCTGPPSTCGGCQPSGHAWDKSMCICMLLGMMATRSLGHLGKVGSKAVSCGKLVKLVSGKIQQGVVLVVIRMAQLSVKILQNAIKALEEKKMSDSTKLGEKGL